ncbi:A/G-specific adenine glycosylase [Bulleidia sp. zg-1006]|uniref:A/G-specific adenine glycosylase n=1 Tax=Bulleidia sp. zg-1006 TaxID=2806552 RepID=UPI00193A3C44|nr:A/G-specific adenine glycosylase [Bulleidia sp. zg-1006]QRG86256.1 A/G-specific adenine glycosylase [Bulleidia sp. zg-1006]
MSFQAKEFQQLIHWYRSHHINYPWRLSKNPYPIWISEIMLQQTRIEAVLPKYERFMQELPSIHDLATVSDDHLMFLWEGLGYYSRARNLKKAAIQIEDKFQGIFPHKLEDIQSLAGIGDYTAGAIASFAFGLGVPAIDGNVLRVYSRHEGIYQNVLDPTMKSLVKEQLLPLYTKENSTDNGDFNQAIMELGEQVCLPKNPNCQNCPIFKKCFSFLQRKQNELPVRISKTKKKTENHSFLIFYTKDKILVHRRSADSLLANLYEPVNLNSFIKIDDFLKEYSLPVLSYTKLKNHKHIFSHRIWQIEAYAIEVSEEFPFLDYQWLEKKKSSLLAFSSAFDPYRLYFY